MQHTKHGELIGKLSDEDWLNVLNQTICGDYPRGRRLIGTQAGAAIDWPDRSGKECCLRIV